MKKALIASVIITLLTFAASESMANPDPVDPGVPQGKSQPGPKHKKLGKKLKERFDADKDGTLNEQEKQALKDFVEAEKAKRQELKTRFDTDKDGKLNEAEKQALKDFVKSQKEPK
jgi:hypothetical protein